MHRYYSSAEYSKEQQLTLKVLGITNKGKNRAFLELHSVDENEAAKNVPVDILKESKFSQENQEREFKSTIVYPTGSTTANIREQLGQICRTLAAFMNTDGGTLYIGVNDSGQVCGIEQDIPHLDDEEEDDHTYQLNCDGYENKIRCTVKNLLGQIANSAIHFEFKKDDGRIYCIVKVDKVDSPIYYNDVFIFVRQGNMSPMLKGEAITYFMAKRLGAAQNGAVMETKMTPRIEEKSVGDDVDKNELLTLKPTPVIEEPEPAEFYLTFYDNGDWSYQNMSIDSDSTLLNVGVTKSQRKDRSSRLIQVYDNGCMNVVGISDIRCKTKGKLYKNGWNTSAKLIAAFCADQHDQIVFFSKDEDGREWIKIHYATCVSCHTVMSTKGNIIINPKHDKARLVGAHLLAKQYQHLVSGLCFKDNETSLTLGVKMKDRGHRYLSP